MALAEFGCIEKTLHTLNHINDENRRLIILRQLNRGEGRHSLARDVFHGKRGELRQEGVPVRDEDVAHLSPFTHERHINLLGRYSFAVPEVVVRGKLRPLKNPNELKA